MIYWRDVYNIGLPFVDSERKMFFSILNKMERLDISEQKKILSSLREKIDVCVAKAFEQEISRFKQTGCPLFLINKQKKEHGEFIEDVKSIFDGEITLRCVSKFEDMLKSFIINHILGTDLEMKKFINKMHTQKFFGFSIQKTLIADIVDKRDLVNWNSYFITGLLDVDNQHKIFVDVLNDLAINYDIYTVEALMAVLQELTYYAGIHFDTEEKYIEEIKSDYGEYENHLKHHVAFREMIEKKQREFKSMVDNGNDITLQKQEEFIKSLIKWLSDHIIGKDKDFARIYLQKHS